MTAIILLIVCSMIVAGAFLLAFLRSVNRGQFDDTYTPSVRMLFEDGTAQKAATGPNTENNQDSDHNSSPTT
jgi:cbb3-type cytochrome oxidase maturation protein